MTDQHPAPGVLPGRSSAASLIGPPHQLPNAKPAISGGLFAGVCSVHTDSGLTASNASPTLHAVGQLQHGVGAMPDGFLRSWIATHVRPVPPEKRSEHVAKWSAECAADAIMASIPYDDLQKAAGGSVLNYIAKVADDVAERLSSLLR